MNGMEALLSQPALEITGQVLLHFLWQGAVIALLLAGVRAILPARDSARRFLAAAGAMFLMLLAPVVTGIVLYLRETPHHGSGGSSGGILFPVPEMLAPLGGGFTSASSMVRASVDPWLSALVLFWVAGVIVLSIRNLTSLVQIRLLTRSGISTPPPEWLAAFGRLARELSVTSRVRLLGSRLVSVPTVVGWLKPVVLVPVGAFTGMHPHHLEAILAHELAHVRRHDYLVNLFLTLVETVLFYHPAVWWVSRQVRVERENCCDDIAVGLCGDPLVYARALADLETRRGQAQLSMGADGGSLLSRVSRLVGRPATPGRDRWVPAILTLVTTLGLLFLGLDARQSPTSAAVAQDDEDGWNLTSILEDGEWEAEYRGDHLTIRVHYGDGDWVVGKSLDSWGFSSREVDAVLASDDIDFDWPRDAGVFHFKGEVVSRGRKTRAEGTFTFEPDPRYTERLEAMGYSRGDIEEHQMELGAHDVSLAFIREFQDLGYENLSLERLMEFRIHGISPDYAKAIARSGYPHLDAERLVEFKIHGISPDYVSAMSQAGYSDLSPERLVEYKIHGLSPDYVREMSRTGYAHLPPERLIEFKIHGISPDYVRDLAQSGYADLDPERVVEFRIHGISPDYAREINQAFQQALSPGKMVEMKIHGVSPDLVRRLMDRVEDLTPDEVLEIKIHGVERYLERSR